MQPHAAMNTVVSCALARGAGRNHRPGAAADGDTDLVGARQARAGHRDAAGLPDDALEIELGQALRDEAAAVG